MGTGSVSQFYHGGNNTSKINLEEAEHLCGY